MNQDQDQDQDQSGGGSTTWLIVGSILAVISIVVVVLLNIGKIQADIFYIIAGLCGVGAFVCFLGVLLQMTTDDN
jgi:uncharacterized membrane protein YiaA